MYHLDMLFKTMSLNFRAKKTNRENNNLEHRTFQEAKRIWEDHIYT